jgi:hypothetical protein
MQFLIAIVISFLSFSDYGQKETQLDWAELRPILKRLKLTSTTRQTENYKTTFKIEEDDAKAYGPVSGVTLFLRTAYFKGSYRPRYWMRVEDYSTTEAALKRATEYKREGRGNFISKHSMKLWAVARGKRVYALTTDALVFEQISLPGELNAAISKLPEK